MHGTIIHYDTLTECGLLRTEAGQLHYFRRDEVAEATGFSTGGYVALRSGTPADTGGSQMDTAEGIATVRLVEQARRAVVSPRPYAPPETQNGLVNWIGSGLALVSLLSLLLVGGHKLGEPAYGAPNPKLIESVYGVAAAVLLVVLSILFVTHKTRRTVRWTYWLVVWMSLFAYVGQTFDGFEADLATTIYGYLLIALFMATLFYPKPNRKSA